MKIKIIISLIVSFFLAISFDFASASVVAPPTGSALYNLWTSSGGITSYLNATNVNTIFDTDFNYLGGWKNIVYYNGNLYNPCLPVYESIRFQMNIYDNAGVRIKGRSGPAYYSCAGDDFTFTADASQGKYTPAYFMDDYINQYSPAYVLIAFGYEWNASPYTAKALIYIDSSGTQYLLNDDFSEYSTAVDGSCGSANGGSFFQIPSTDLCSSGNLDFGVVNDGESFVWSCAGSGGGSNEYCYASVVNTTAQCGYSNGSVALTEPYLNHACLNGSITDMTQNDDDSWSWKCQSDSDSTDFVFCNTMASAPLIPGTLPSNDSISCSISITDLSTFADCLGSIIRWAFLPHQDTLNSFYSIPQTLASKSPFGYFYAISDQLKSVSLNSPPNLVISMKSFDSSDVVLLDVNSFKSWAGPEAVNFYFNIARALLWIGFLIWVFNKGRNIFSSNDNEK